MKTSLSFVDYPAFLENPAHPQFAAVKLTPVKISTATVSFTSTCRSLAMRQACLADSDVDLSFSCLRSLPYKFSILSQTSVHCFASYCVMATLCTGQ